MERRTFTFKTRNVELDINSRWMVWSSSTLSKRFSCQIINKAVHVETGQYKIYLPLCLQSEIQGDYAASNRDCETREDKEFRGR